jgi:type I restriction enzyme S subunit
MSKIDKLLEKFCPNGIDYLSLGEIVNILDNLRKPVAKDKRVEGQYPYYGANGIQSYINDYIFDGVFILMGEDGSVVNKDGTPVLNYVSGKIWVNNHAHVLQEKNDGPTLKYLYYALSVTKIDYLVRGTPPKLNQANLRSILLPVPPIEVQNEIVRILDNFTELEARTKQYEYYRNKLLDFSTGSVGVPRIDKMLAEMCPNGVERNVISKIFTLKNGYTPSKAKKEYWENGSIPWFRMEDLRTNGNILSESIQHVTPSAIKGNLFPANSIIISTSATIGEHALVLVEHVSNQRFTNLTPNSSYKDRINMKYMNYYMFIVSEWCKSNTNVSGFASVDMNGFRNLEIPIPPIEVQNEIVRILDNFSEYVASITHGLPAEIAARRKQYEYYRNKILTF